MLLTKNTKIAILCNNKEEWYQMQIILLNKNFIWNSDKDLSFPIHHKNNLHEIPEDFPLVMYINYYDNQTITWTSLPAYYNTYNTYNHFEIIPANTIIRTYKLKKLKKFK